MSIDKIKQKVLEDIDPEIKQQKRKQAIRSYIIVSLQFAVLIVLIIVFFYIMMGLSTIEGNSMYPTLHDGDRVFYKRTSDDYRVGDVVVVDRPDGEEFVKRIVAVAGDTVNIQGGKVYINGEEQILDGPVGETYLVKDSDIPNPYRVGDGQVFVLGDNRLNSEDSRSFGAVKIEDLSGRLIWYFGRL